MEPEDDQKSLDDYIRSTFSMQDVGWFRRESTSTFEPETPTEPFEGDPVESEEGENWRALEAEFDAGQPVQLNMSPRYTIDWGRVRVDLDLDMERRRMAEEAMQNAIAEINAEILRSQAIPGTMFATASSQGRSDVPTGTPPRPRGLSASLDWSREEYERARELRDAASVSVNDFVRDRMREDGILSRNPSTSILTVRDPDGNTGYVVPRPDSPTGLVSFGAYEIQSTEYESSGPISVREWIEQAREVFAREGRDLSETLWFDSLEGIATVRDADGNERTLVPGRPPERPAPEPHYTTTTGIRPRRIRVAR